MQHLSGRRRQVKVQIVREPERSRRRHLAVTRPDVVCVRKQLAMRRDEAHLSLPVYRTPGGAAAQLAVTFTSLPTAKNAALPLALLLVGGHRQHYFARMDNSSLLLAINSS